MNKSPRLLALLSVFCLFAITSVISISYADDAQHHLLMNSSDQPKHNTPPTLVPAAPNIDAKGYVLMDADTGNIIAQKNMNMRMSPASLTKMMTLYLVFQSLKSGQIHLDDLVRISKKSWKTGGSRMFLKIGSQVPVSQLIPGVIVASGNDACVALAQYIAGTEETFAQMMNQAAQRLGMTDTHYVDSTGLPRSDHYSTPHDMAILARAIIQDFPEYYYFFKQKWIKYNNIRQPNRNRLLWRDNAVDGLKTGHTQSAGYCLVASALHNKMRLISVVMGTPSDSARANDSQALLSYGFRFYKTYLLFQADQTLNKERVWFGHTKYVNFGLENPLYVTIPAGDYDKLQAAITVNNGDFTAPIEKGKQYETLVVHLNGKVVAKAPIVALEQSDKGGFFRRMSDHVAKLFHGWFN